MILLPCDEGFAFDYLAILYVKRDNGLAVDFEISRVEEHLLAQLPEMKIVLPSEEFIALVKANQCTFEAIEKAHRNALSARDVQLTNKDRCQAKRRLQARFWPDRPIEEKKTEF